MLYFSRIRNVKLPGKGSKGAAGIDFYIPEFDKIFMENFFEKNKEEKEGIEFVIADGLGEIRINPHTRVLIPSGIKARIPRGYALIAFNKSGISTRHGLDVLASVVDEDYQGEIHISLVNTSNMKVALYSGNKIIQFILLPIVSEVIAELPIEKLYPEKTERGDGGFGSTGN